MSSNYVRLSSNTVFAGAVGNASAANQVVEIQKLTSIDNELQSANITLISLDSKTPTPGQKTMANSSPVTIASDQTPVPVVGPITDTQLRASVVKVVDGLGSTGVNGNLNLVTASTAYEAKVGATRLAARKSVVIQATDGDMYWGYNSSVTSATGTLLYKNQTIEFACDPGSTFQVYLVSILANKNARIAEST